MAAPLALTLLAVLVACGSADSSGDSAPAGEAPDGVTSRDWVSTLVTVDGQERPLVDGTQIALSFGATGDLAADAGCNQLSGSTSWDSDSLTVAGLGGTEMGCDPKRMDQDAWLSDLLLATPTVQVDGDTMTLTAGPTVIAFVDREAAMPDRALAGTLWVLDGLGSGTADDAALGSVPAGVRSTLSINGNELSLKPGCNSAGGAVEVTADTLSFGPIAATLMDCPGARSDVEQVVLGVLTGEVAYSIDEDTLTLTRGDSVLVYRADAGLDG